jgi:hypothetical protein
VFSHNNQTKVMRDESCVMSKIWRRLVSIDSSSTHHSSLITHHSSLITHHSSLITHDSSLITPFLSPFQRAFAPGVIVTNHQNSDEDKHLDECEFRKRKVVTHENDRPGQ